MSTANLSYPESRIYPAISPLFQLVKHGFDSAENGSSILAAPIRQSALPIAARACCVMVVFPSIPIPTM